MRNIIKFDAPQILSLLVAMVCLLIVVSTRSNLITPPAKNFVFDRGGELIYASHFPTPLYNDSKVINFARKAVTKCFSITPEVAKRLLAGNNKNSFSECISSNFAGLASKTLTRAYPSDKALEQIAEFDAPAEVIIPITPSVVARNKPTEPLKWMVSMPFTVTIQSVSAEDTFSFWVLLTIVPEEHANNPSNLLISMVAFS